MNAPAGDLILELRFQTIVDIGLGSKRGAADRCAHQCEVNPRLAQLAEDFVFDVFERDAAAIDHQLQVFPDVVAPQSWRVVTNAGRWELA